MWSFKMMYDVFEDLAKIRSLIVKSHKSLVYF